MSIELITKYLTRNLQLKPFHYADKLNETQNNTVKKVYVFFVPLKKVVILPPNLIFSLQLKI